MKDVKTHNPLHHKATPWMTRKRALMITTAVFVVFGGVFIGLTIHAKSYEQVSFPGIYVGDVPVGDMTEPMLISFFQEMNDKLANEGIILTIDHEEKPKHITIYPTVVSSDEYINLVYIDAKKASEQILKYKKSSNPIINTIAAIQVRLHKPSIKVDNAVVIDTMRFSELLNEQLVPHEQEFQNAKLIINQRSPYEYTIASSSVGRAFSHNMIHSRIKDDWSRLELPRMTIEAMVKTPKITEEDVKKVADRAEHMLSGGELVISFDNPQNKRKHRWALTQNNLQELIAVQKNDEDQIVIGLHKEDVETYVQEVIMPEVEREAKNAKFKIAADGKVTEFQGSRPGIAVDQEQMYESVNDAFVQRFWHDEGFSSNVSLVIKQTEPDIKTGEVNDLGIKEVLGVGYSNFSGSPTNRVKNIRLAVEGKLNGLLIKPGEEFSMIKALGPFTLEGGYLPELVIKGDEIKPEIGGGLCQIGSTMFRAAMNSGLEITQRRNHSLVVSYYNDVRNGLPGTDATIYDPAPDFRYKNDTDGHILITAEMNAKTGDLYFTLWGTSDGRKAHYTEPVVHKWIPAGPTKFIETTKLAPGQKNCQGKHNGASASFTYIKELPDGEKIERVFTSYYRPLPQICLVGVGAKQQPQTDDPEPQPTEPQPTEPEPQTETNQEPATEEPTEEVTFDPTEDYSVPTVSR